MRTGRVPLLRHESSLNAGSPLLLSIIFAIILTGHPFGQHSSMAPPEPGRLPNGRASLIENVEPVKDQRGYPRSDMPFSISAAPSSVTGNFYPCLGWTK